MSLQEMATVSSITVCLLLAALLSGANSQAVTVDCGLLDQAPSDAVFVQGEGGCFNCTYGFRAPRWDIELDSGFTAIGDPTPDECDCALDNRMLCFENVQPNIAQNYRCQIQEPSGSNLVECNFQIQLARPPVIADGNRIVTGDPESTVTLSLSLSEPGLPSATVEWYKGSTLLSTTGRFSNDSSGSLTITDLNPEDRGDYQVRVINSAGSATADYQLFVNFAVVELTSTTDGDMVQIVCRATGHPLELNDLFLTGAGVQATSNSRTYELSIEAIETVNQANCQPTYRCEVTIESVGIATSSTLTPCGSSTFMITEVKDIMATSATVVWTYSGVSSFTVSVTGPGVSRQIITQEKMALLPGLLPESDYTVTVEVSPPTDPNTIQSRSFTTASCPSSFEEPIRRVTADIMTSGTQRTIKLAWEASSENDVSGYRLYLDPCGDDLQCIVPVSGRETISHEYSTSICDGRSYSFSVQSINDCGAGGPNSSLVRQTCEIINQLVGLEPRSTRVTFNWHFVQAPLSMVVTASLEGSPSASQNKLLTYDLDSTLARDTACIQGLEADTTYEICLQPRFSQSSSDTNLYCMFTTTLENDGSTEAMTDCVTPTRTQPADQVIQNWQIAVIVVGGLAVVAMVFCLVGLCFACQSSKQKVDFGSNSSLNTNYNSSSINGVSMTHQRSMSPARSCLSYHTKGHSTNWNDHVDTLRQMETDTGTNV